MPRWGSRAQSCRPAHGRRRANPPRTATTTTCTPEGLGDGGGEGDPEPEAEGDGEPLGEADADADADAAGDEGGSGGTERGETEKVARAEHTPTRPCAAHGTATAEPSGPPEP